MFAVGRAHPSLHRPSTLSLPVASLGAQQLPGQDTMLQDPSLPHTHTLLPQVFQRNIRDAPAAIRVHLAKHLKWQK